MFDDIDFGYTHLEKQFPTPRNIQLYEIDFIWSQYAEVTNISEDIKYVVFQRVHRW